MRRAPRDVHELIAHIVVLNMPSQAALLIGAITHARKEWESLSSVLNLKVRHIWHRAENPLTCAGIP